MRRLFEKDPLTGITRYWRHNPADDTAYIETEQHVEDMLDANKAEYNSAGTDWKGDMHKVASIPMTVYHDLKARGIIDDPARLKAWLNDPHNRYFRTRPGKV